MDMFSTIRTPAPRRYYDTTTLCPVCSRLLPGNVFGRNGAVYLSRECPEHGAIEALVCSDVNWFEGLQRFDVPPIKPSHPRTSIQQGCPPDCGLCSAHRQLAGTMAIEISMQFMDSWTFDTERLSKCSCQHLLRGNRRVPSCGYYAYHRQRDARFA